VRLGGIREEAHAVGVTAGARAGTVTWLQYARWRLRGWIVRAVAASMSAGSIRTTVSMALIASDEPTAATRATTVGVSGRSATT
jgi:hypothetical protein